MSEDVKKSQKDGGKGQKNGDNEDKWKFKQDRRELTGQEKQWKKIAYIIFIGFLTLFIGQILVYTFVFDINDWVGILIIFIVLVMPAYLSNAGMLMMGGGKPMDGGKMAKDGRRLFGPGKTWRGFILGPLVWGIGVSLIIHSIFYLNWDKLVPYIFGLFDGENTYDLIDRSGQAAVDLYQLYLIGGTHDSMVVNFILLFLRVTIVSFGAATGDLIGSWLKRRLDRKRGEPVWLVDQLDFIIFVLLCAMPFVPINVDYLTIVIFSLIFTPSLTVCANMIAYALGHKSVPY
ncbi:MAG: CDP-archaeol synthase [Candidatus Lokiarchaeota archaeon]|nr:CDP-archaeol synthase [Candidatus Lokiarchaeota archaeon]